MAELTEVEKSILNEIASEHPFHLHDVIRLYKKCKSYDVTIKTMEYSQAHGLGIDNVFVWDNKDKTNPNKVEGAEEFDTKTLKEFIEENTQGLFEDFVEDEDIKHFYQGVIELIAESYATSQMNKKGEEIEKNNQDLLHIFKKLLASGPVFIAARDTNTNSLFGRTIKQAKEFLTQLTK